MPVTYITPGAPSNTSQPDGQAVPQLGGKAGEGIVAELHGVGFTASYRNRSFIASTAAAGITIPISTTTAATFALYNPIGSGVVAELLNINIGMTTITAVASPILLGYISGLLVAPTGLTARTINPANIGGTGAAACSFLTAATLAAAASTFITIGHLTATSGAFPLLNVDLKGSIVLQPGSLVHLCGTAAQTQATTGTIIYNEFPV